MAVYSDPKFINSSDTHATRPPSSSLDRSLRSNDDDDVLVTLSSTIHPSQLGGQPRPNRFHHPFTPHYSPNLSLLPTYHSAWHPLHPPLLASRPSIPHPIPGWVLTMTHQPNALPISVRNHLHLGLMDPPSTTRSGALLPRLVACCRD